MTQPAPNAPSLDLPSWLLSPEHAARMGGALWVFLWLWREGQDQESPHVRAVRGGAVVRVEEIAEALGLNERTVRRHLGTLCEAGYLNTWREAHGFTAVVNIWRPAPGQQPERPDSSVRSLAPARSNLSDHQASDRTTLSDDSARVDSSVRSQHPPAPPLRVLEESSLDSSSSEDCLNVPTSAKRAQVVPFKPVAEGPAPAAVVVAGSSPGRLRQEQAIAHLIGRIEDWERPALTKTLLEALCAVPLTHLPAVFDQAWRFHRTRRKDLDNPAGWWAETLRRCAEACARDVKGERGYG